MGLFGIKLESPNENAKPIKLEKHYKFMYENFVISSQHTLYILLEENDGIIDALSFDFKIYKYGYPNDEVGLPSKIKGVETYGFSEVINSNWIKELKVNNRSHPRHQESIYSTYKHYIIRFKDVTLEVISSKYQIVKMTRKDIDEFLNKEIGALRNVG